MVGGRRRAEPFLIDDDRPCLLFSMNRRRLRVSAQECAVTAEKFSAFWPAPRWRRYRRPIAICRSRRRRNIVIFAFWDAQGDVLRLFSRAPGIRCIPRLDSYSLAQAAIWADSRRTAAAYSRSNRWNRTSEPLGRRCGEGRTAEESDPNIEQLCHPAAPHGMYAIRYWFHIIRRVAAPRASSFPSHIEFTPVVAPSALGALRPASLLFRDVRHGGLPTVGEFQRFSRRARLGRVEGRPIAQLALRISERHAQTFFPEGGGVFGENRVHFSRPCVVARIHWPDLACTDRDRSFLFSSLFFGGRVSSNTIEVAFEGIAWRPETTGRERAMRRTSCSGFRPLL